MSGPLRGGFFLTHTVYRLFVFVYLDTMHKIGVWEWVVI